MPARLHHDFVTDPAGAAPRAWALFTHGIYGSGGNWRAIARQVVTRRPEWGVVLVDLRQHGRSEPGEPPHTLAACAGDLVALVDELSGGGRIVRALVGHSFGGKVVLAARAHVEPAQAWVLDSTPSARAGEWEAPANSVREVWESMRALERTWTRREDFVAAMVERGHAPALAHWVAMNLAPDGSGGYRLRLDLDAIRALLLDYYEVDLWPAVEDAALPGEVWMVVAGRSSTVSADDRARLASLEGRRVHTRTLDAGHWLHIDAPAAVVELLAAELPSSP
ncbi:MAG: alpha/beta hydrolase [Deltaproteobacteria bacterium]|nr:alpha/beta hydrolase [Kofleriaceae bacterium]